MYTAYCIVLIEDFSGVKQSRPGSLPLLCADGYSQGFYAAQEEMSDGYRALAVASRKVSQMLKSALPGKRPTTKKQNLQQQQQKHQQHHP